jgi:methionine-rich copper-binding protein CopC
VKKMQILRGVMAVASAGIVAILMTASPASANSLTSSSPAAGAVLASAPNAISVTGTAPLSDQGSTLSVTDPTGLQVDDGSLTINESTAVIGLKPLTAPGVYTVTYNLVSTTDAPLMASYTFLFNAPAAISSPTPTPIQSSAAPTTKANHTVDIFVIILMVAAVFVGLFLLWYARMLIREQQENKRRSRSRSKNASRPTRSKNTDED